MPITRTVEIQAVCRMGDTDIYLRAVPWANNLFRLVSAVYWDIEDHSAPKQCYMVLENLPEDTRHAFLDTIVNEWNLYSYEKNKIERNKAGLVIS